MSNLHHLLIRGLLPLLLLFGCLSPAALAQDDPRALDPSDVFFQAWLIVTEAEKLEKADKHAEAWRKYRQAAKYYDLISRYHKNWKPDLVQRRVQTTQQAIKTIEPKAAAQIAGNDAQTKDLVESGTPSSSPEAAKNHRRYPAARPIPSKAPAPAPKAPPQIVREVIKPDPELQRKLKVLEIDNRRLKDQLKRSRATAMPNNRMEQERLIKLIAEKDRQITALTNTLSRAPLQQDMDRLNKENQTRERELAITAQALLRTKKKLEQAEKLRRKHQEEAELAERRLATLQKNTALQKKVDNRVVRELRKELKTVTALLQKTRTELGAANQRVNQMQTRLTQAETTIKELQTERDALKLERDTLASVLKKSDSKGVQRLITENMRLGQELKQALDRLQYLEKSNNSTKDELIQAKSDLAIAKTRIMRYQQEKSAQDKMIRSLENRLQQARDELADAIANPSGNINEEEVEILQATVKRLIAAQDRRKMGEKILWDTYQNSKIQIPGMAKAYADLMKTNFELNEEEKKMVAARMPDGEFTSPQRVSPEHARIHGAALEKEVATFTPLIKRFFKKGRYEAARETLLELDERLPGHFPTICNRGVVEIKTGRFEEAREIFNEAITMRENSGYAHYMLGKTQYLLKNLDAAQKSFLHSLTLRSDNPDAHLHLGNIAGAGRRFKLAEEHFNEAIKLDPTKAEAYFNLSIIYLRQNKKQQALEAYNKALDKGAQPDPSHERKLGQSSN